MARVFLYLCALIIAVTIAVAVAWRVNPGWFMRTAFVSSQPFVPPPAQPTNIYANPALWIARPGMHGDNPTLWLPRTAPAADPAAATGAATSNAAAPRFAVEARRGDAAIFFIHPTSHLTRNGWNASLDDAEANWRATLFTRGMASVFAGAGDVWVPRYRQAAMGAFLTRDVDTANAALNAAYVDVAAAFDDFIAEVPRDQPIILAGHSQGSLHLARLLRERVAGTPLARRIVAAYVIGWPVSETIDLPLMGLPACAHADSSGCVLAWQDFASPADPSMILDVYDASIGFNGQPRTGSRMLCVNPITGERDGAAPATANLGTLKADGDLKDGTLFPAGVGARCDDPAAGGRGFLMIDTAVDLGGYLLPGNNYHVYDYSLYWQNIRADVNRRLAAFEAHR